MEIELAEVGRKEKRPIAKTIRRLRDDTGGGLSTQIGILTMSQMKLEIEGSVHIKNQSIDGTMRDDKSK